ncbi:MAG: hypothetical protein U1F52_15280 [Burkholderiales bacterium]
MTFDDADLPSSLRGTADSLAALPPGLLAEITGKPLSDQERATVELAEAMRRKAEETWAAGVALRQDGVFRLHADAHLQAQGIDPASVPLAVVPHNPEALAPQPQGRREAFERHFDTVLAEALADPHRPSDPTIGLEMAATAEPPWAERELCGTCGGRCCRLGGTHAYLSADTLRRVMRADHAPSGSALRDHYLSRIPPDAIAGSCVFHGPQGCALDRSFRSDTCNQSLCDGLRHFRRTPGARDARRVYVIAAAGDTIARGVIIEAD